MVYVFLKLYSSKFFLQSVALHFVLIEAHLPDGKRPSMSSPYGQISFYPSPKETKDFGFKPAKNASLFHKGKNNEKEKSRNSSKQYPKIWNIFKTFANRAKKQKNRRNLQQRQFKDLETSSANTHFKVIQVPIKVKERKRKKNVQNVLILRGRGERNATGGITQLPLNMFPPPIVPIHFPPKVLSELTTPISLPNDLHLTSFDPPNSNNKKERKKNILTNDRHASLGDQSNNSDFPNKKSQDTQNAFVPITPPNSLLQNSRAKESNMKKNTVRLPAHLRGKKKRVHRPPSPVAILPRPLKFRQTQTRHSIKNPKFNTPKPLSEILGNQFHSGTRQEAQFIPSSEKIKPTSTTFKIIKLKNLYRDSPNTFPSHVLTKDVKSTFSESNKHLRTNQENKVNPLIPSQLQLSNLNVSSYSSINPVLSNHQLDRINTSLSLKLPHKLQTTFVNEPTFEAIVASQKAKPILPKFPPFSQSPFHPRPLKPPVIVNIPERVPSNLKPFDFPNTATEPGNFVFSQTLPAKNPSTSVKLQNGFHIEDHLSALQKRPESDQIKPHLNTLSRPNILNNSISRPHSWTYIDFNPTPPPSFVPSSSVKKEKSEILDPPNSSRQKPTKLLAEFPTPQPSLNLPHPFRGNVLNKPALSQILDQSSTSHLTPQPNFKNFAKSKPRRPMKRLKTPRFPKNSKIRVPISTEASKFISRPSPKSQIKPSQPHLKFISNSLRDQEFSPSNKEQTQVQ